MTTLLLSTGVFTATFAYLLAPGRVDPYMTQIFKGRNYAHRGLHNLDDGIPENSLSAFRAARDNGFGIELDLQMTADGQVVVFHDTDLSRICGVEAHVHELTYDELKNFKLMETNEKIPLFSEALETMGGLQPIVVEIKPSYKREELCQNALALLRQYKGEYCVESFDPFILAWFRKNAPEIVRGQLTMRMAKAEREVINLGRTASFMLSHCYANFLSRPHFIAHRLEKKSLAVRLAEKMGAMRFAWTSQEYGHEENFDSIIFEGYMPEPQFDKE